MLARADRRGEDPQPAPGHLSVGLGGAPAAFTTERQQQIHRALDVEHAVRASDRHALALGIEGMHRLTRPGPLDLGTVDPSLGAGGEQRDLGGIAGAGAPVRGQLGVAAGAGRVDQPGMVLAPQLAHGHHPGGACAGLVRADDGGAAQGLHRGEPADEDVPAGHALDADGQGDGDHGGQPLGHRRHRQRDGRHEDREQPEPAQQA
jgi:hypothetical protein